MEVSWIASKKLGKSMSPILFLSIKANSFSFTGTERESTESRPLENSPKLRNPSLFSSNLLKAAL